MQYTLEPWAVAPTKGYDTDAGWDIYSPKEVVVLSHDFSERINLGVAFAVPEGYCGMVIERSSQGKVGLSSIGVLVDFGYTGNIHVTIVNHGFDPVRIKKGDRICQVIFPAIYTGQLGLVDKLPSSERKKNGHGSTGK